MTTKEKIKTGALGVFSTIILSTGIYSLVLRPDGTEYTKDNCPYFWETSEGFCYTEVKQIKNKIKEKSGKISKTKDANIFIELCNKEKDNTKCKEVYDDLREKLRKADIKKESPEAMDWNEFRTLIGTTEKERKEFTYFKGFTYLLLELYL